MWQKLLQAAALSGVLAAPLGAQIRDVPGVTRNWVSGWAGMYTNVDGVGDPATSSTWAFDDNVFAFGAGIEREVTQGLLLGLEAGYSSTDWERRTGDAVAATGTAKLLSAFASGRYRYGGGARIGGYLKGMAGVFGYQVPDPDETNFDLALSSGAGLEFRVRPRMALYLEWNRIWAYHEKEGIDGGNTGRHSVLRLGLRGGF